MVMASGQACDWTGESQAPHMVSLLTQNGEDDGYFQGFKLSDTGRYRESIPLYIYLRLFYRFIQVTS